LSTPWSRSVGIDVPIVNAPMGGAAGGRLAVAVARAGGLGMVGMGSSATVDALTTQLEPVRGLDRSFGIGLVGWVMTAQPQLLEVALDARPALLSVSFGDDWSWVARVRDAGVTAVTQVGSLDVARRAVDGGVQVLVARGAEGGGHGEPRIGTLPLLADLLDTLDVPVLAAGGIASPRALAAVLAAGASAAWLGTVFAACPEAMTTPQHREALVAAEGVDTTLTRQFDLAQGHPWPAHLPERVLTDRRGAPTPVNAGQGVGAVTTAEPAAELIARLCGDAEDLLRRAGGL
jgi:nitronate monooxygenase